MRFSPLLAAAGTLIIGTAAPAFAGETLDGVKQKGFVQCGVSTGLPGFSSTNDQGEWTGLDVDVCRAIAAAIFDDPQAVKFTPLTSKERFTALQSGEIDILSRNTTWTLQRDAALGLEFTGVSYYDGQGFMVPTDLGVTAATELDGAAVCVQPGTTTELNLADYFRTHDMNYTPVVFENDDEIRVAFEQGRCDVFTTDASGLYSNRLGMPTPDNYEVLPEIISKEPLGPAVRQGDSEWADIARWVLFALINAEELGVTSENVDQMMENDNPNIKRLLGTEDTMGEYLKLDSAWAAQAIKHVGNYGEIFERNVGSGSPLNIERGINALWTEGGVMYAPPVR